MKAFRFCVFLYFNTPNTPVATVTRRGRERAHNGRCRLGQVRSGQICLSAEIQDHGGMRVTRWLGLPPASGSRYDRHAARTRPSKFEQCSKFKFAVTLSGPYYEQCHPSAAPGATASEPRRPPAPAPAPGPAGELECAVTRTARDSEPPGHPGPPAFFGGCMPTGHAHARPRRSALWQPPGTARAGSAAY